MNNCPGRGPGPRPSWPRRGRVAAVITVMAAALLVAACSGGPSSTGSGGSPNAGRSATSPSALAFSRCMRSHGVPNFPDPPASFNGKFPGSSPQQLGISQSRFRSATEACWNLLPAVPGSARLTTQDQQDYLRAAACMRSHGITNFPDPVFSGGSVHFPIPSGIDTTSTPFTQARQTCERLIPAGLPYSSSGSGG